MINPIITSTSNPQIKAIRKLKDRKYRNESGLFFLEGIRITIEALTAKNWVRQLIVARELMSNEKAVQAVTAAEKNNIEILEVSGEVFRSISGKDGPQGLAAVGQQKWTELAELNDLTNGIWIGLYQIADPGNLGTILRTLDGMGGKGALLIDNCTDPYDPTAIRASMGAVFSKKIVKTTTQDFLNWKKTQSIPLVGTSDAAESDYRDFSYTEPMILLMGSEREGIPSELAQACDAILSIPMMGNADSLNLAVASSIILYEIAWQRQMNKKLRESQ